MSVQTETQRASTGSVGAREREGRTSDRYAERRSDQTPGRFGRSFQTRVQSLRRATGRTAVPVIAEKSTFIPQKWQRKTGRAATMIESFYHAFRGIVVGVKEQRNLRIHFSAVAVVLGLGLWLKVDSTAWIALTVAMALVIAAEFLNTALEHLVDIASGGQFHQSARNAKDTAAAAVLVASVAACVIGALVFVPRLILLLPLAR